jgi:hypothetical protein
MRRRIPLIRGEKAIIDSNLAEACGVPAKALNQAIRQNAERFPPEFMLRLAKKEKQQEAATNRDRLQNLKFSPINPCVFTEHGAIIGASLLNSPKAIVAGIFVLRAFIRLREMIAGHKELARKIAEFERKSGSHDGQIMILVEPLKQRMDPKLPPKTRRIEFHPD